MGEFSSFKTEKLWGLLKYPCLLYDFCFSNDLLTSYFFFFFVCFVVAHILLRHMNAALPWIILDLTSLGVPPSLSIVLPRYVILFVLQSTTIDKNQYHNFYSFIH